MCAVNIIAKLFPGIPYQCFSMLKLSTASGHGSTEKDAVARGATGPRVRDRQL